MTIAEIERLAVLEVQFRAVQSDVSEIKADVKDLIKAQTQMAVAMATNNAVAVQTERTRSNTGVWVRSFLPWLVAVAMFALAMINTLSR